MSKYFVSLPKNWVFKAFKKILSIFILPSVPEKTFVMPTIRIT